MMRTARKGFLALHRGGHTYFIVYDAASVSQLLDHLLDLAEDRETPLTWRDVFCVIDSLPRRTRVYA